MVPRSPKGGRAPLFPEWSVHVTMLVLQASLGLYHVLAKLALKEGVDQLVFCVWRDVIALALLGPPAYYFERSLRPVMTTPLLRTFVLLGATGILGNQLLFLIGLNFTGPATAAALQPSIQVFTFTLAVALGVETLNWQRRKDWAKVAGVAVCIAGALVLGLFRGVPVLGSADAESSPGIEGEGRNLLEDSSAAGGGAGLTTWHLGVLSLLGNCACMAVYLTVQAPLLVVYPAPLSVTALAYLFGTGMMVTLGVLLSSASTVWTLTSPQLLAVVYAGVVNSAIGYFLVTWANKRVGPAVVALYTPLQPVSSALLSRLILGSTIYLGSILGGVLVLCGLYLYIWGKAESKGAKDGSIHEGAPLQSTDGAPDVEELQGLVTGGGLDSEKGGGGGQDWENVGGSGGGSGRGWSEGPPHTELLQSDVGAKSSSHSSSRDAPTFVLRRVGEPRNP